MIKITKEGKKMLETTFGPKDRQNLKSSISNLLAMHAGMSFDLFLVRRNRTM